MAKRGARYCELTEREKQLKCAANKAWRERHRAQDNAIKRAYRQKNGEAVRAYAREYDAFRRTELRVQERNRYYRNHEHALAVRRHAYLRTRQQQQAEEQQIVKLMEGVERDATRIGTPSPERMGILSRRKDPRKTAVGKTPARTVAYRLAARRATDG